MAEASWQHVNAPDARLRVEEIPAIRANVRRLQRLLENLFRNAVEHGGARVEIRVGPLSDGFFVEDDGPGVPREVGARVFEAGYSSADEGTGLGLSIVHTIAEAHGWDVSVVAGRDGGARFEFTGVSQNSPGGRARSGQENRVSLQTDQGASVPVGRES